jgi:hypothetical protein
MKKSIYIRTFTVDCNLYVRLKLKISYLKVEIFLHFCFVVIWPLDVAACKAMTVHGSTGDNIPSIMPSSLRVSQWILLFAIGLTREENR